MTWLQQLGIVALAGAAGAICRFAIATSLARWTGGTFPWGTLLVNLVGCLAIGRFLGSSWADQEGLRLAVAVGFLGSFTTFSALEAETLVMLRTGRVLPAVAYVAASIVLGLLAVWLGWRWGNPPQSPVA